LPKKGGGPAGVLNVITEKKRRGEGRRAIPAFFIEKRRPIWTGGKKGKNPRVLPNEGKKKGESRKMDRFLGKEKIKKAALSHRV